MLGHNKIIKAENDEGYAGVNRCVEVSVTNVPLLRRIYLPSTPDDAFKLVVNNKGCLVKKNCSTKNIQRI